MSQFFQFKAIHDLSLIRTALQLYNIETDLTWMNSFPFTLPCRNNMKGKNGNKELEWLLNVELLENCNVLNMILDIVMTTLC